jgi:hypothetical protein
MPLSPSIQGGRNGVNGSSVCVEQVRVAAVTLHSCNPEGQLRYSDMPTSGGSLTLAESLRSRMLSSLRSFGKPEPCPCESKSDGTRDGRRLSVLWVARPGIHTTSRGRPAAPAAARAPRLPRALPFSVRAAIRDNPSARRPPLKASSACARRAASSAGVESFR